MDIQWGFINRITHRARFFLLQLCILSNATCYSLPRGFTDILRYSYGSLWDKSNNFNETRRSDDNRSLWRTNLTRSIRQSRLVIKKTFRGNLIISFTCNCSVYLKSRHSRKKMVCDRHSLVSGNFDSDSQQCRCICIRLRDSIMAGSVCNAASKA